MSAEFFAALRRAVKKYGLSADPVPWAIKSSSRAAQCRATSGENRRSGKTVGVSRLRVGRDSSGKCARARRILTCGDLFLRKMEPRALVPGLGLHQPAEKLNSLGVTSVVGEQGGGGIEIFKRLTDSEHQTAQDVHGSGGVSVLQTNLRQAKHVGRVQLMRRDLLNKQILQKFTCPRTLAGGLQRGRNLAQTFRVRRFLRIGAILIQNRIELAAGQSNAETNLKLGRMDLAAVSTPRRHDRIPAVRQDAWHNAPATSG